MTKRVVYVAPVASPKRYRVEFFGHFSQKWVDSAETYDDLDEARDAANSFSRGGLPARVIDTQPWGEKE